METQKLLKPKGKIVVVSDYREKEVIENLKKLGFKPTHTLDQELEITLKKLIQFKDRIESKRKHIMPTIKWRGT